MSQFKITTKEGLAIDLNELDKEAAAFWGKEVNEQQYASPHKTIEITENMSSSEKIKIAFENARNETLNWFDCIGWKIAYSVKNEPTWDDIIIQFIEDDLKRALISKYGLIDFKASLTTANHAEINNDAAVNLESTLEFYRPYSQLIKHWESKGYKPVKIKE